MLTVQQALEFLSKGDPLIVPTDTLYGLSALAYNYMAVKKVFDLKKRDYLKPLPVHYSNIDLIAEDCLINREALSFMKKYWPGGLTIVLKIKVNSKLTFVTDSVAVRIPKSRILLQILNELNQPLVMPSANLSGYDNLFYFDDIQELFQVQGIKDDSLLRRKPSTIISFLDGNLQILREGVISL